MAIQPADAAFLRSRFRAYYAAHPVKGPPAILNREFGVGDAGKKIVQRHLAFDTPHALNAFLQREAPLFISSSAAYYARPAATPMEAKGLLGADLVYEFDAGDLALPCQARHNRWQCSACDASGEGAPSRCLQCGGRAAALRWVCAACLQEAKRQTLRLLGVLERELGLHEEAAVNFSGNAGYHLYIRARAVRALPAHARLALLNYLTLEGLDLDALGFEEEKNGGLALPPLSRLRGAPRRMVARALSLLENAPALELAAHTGAREKSVAALLQDRETVTASLVRGLAPPLPRTAAARSHAFWRALFARAAELERFPLDRQTSADIKKIVRVPDTLHGGTGLAARTVPLPALKAFDPFTDAVAFPEEDTVRVQVEEAPAFTLASARFGPFRHEEADLPLAAAVYLVAQGRAHVQEAR